MRCFCGVLSTPNCLAAPDSGAGAPAGACADAIRASMRAPGGPVASNQDVLVRYVDEQYPGGAAISRSNCDKADPACTAVCGF